MRRSYLSNPYTPQGEVVNPVFHVPLLNNFQDVVSGAQGSDEIYFNTPTIGDERGAYFNGNNNLSFNTASLSFHPESWNINTSFTILLDYYRTVRIGHDWMLVIGTDSSKNLVGFLYEYNSQTISIAIASGQYPHWITCDNRTSYTELNKQYVKCGVVYDGTTHTAHRVINGHIVNSFSITSFPVIPANGKIYIGCSSYSGDRMNGYLRNIMVFDKALTEQQILEI